MDGGNHQPRAPSDGAAIVRSPPWVAQQSVFPGHRQRAVHKSAPACTTLIKSSRRDPFLSPARRALLEPSVVDEGGFVSLPGFLLPDRGLRPKA